MRTVLAGVAIAAICLPILAAQEEEKPPVRAIEEDARFEALKGLAGEWLQVDGDGKVSEEVALMYRVTACESVVVETLHPGTRMEMLTVYHMDRDDLVMTHYCAMRNQPSMKAEAEVKDKRLGFVCDVVGNVESHDDAHMHALTLMFEDDDRLGHEWGMFEGGKIAKKVEMSFVRKVDE